jgi:hypothetical protein
MKEDQIDWDLYQAWDKEKYIYKFCNSAWREKTTCKNQLQIE